MFKIGNFYRLNKDINTPSRVFPKGSELKYAGRDFEGDFEFEDKHHYTLFLTREFAEECMEHIFEDYVKVDGRKTTVTYGGVSATVKKQPHEKADLEKAVAIALLKIKGISYKKLLNLIKTTEFAKTYTFETDKENFGLEGRIDGNNFLVEEFTESEIENIENLVNSTMGKKYNRVEVALKDSCFYSPIVED